jgi:putative DNA primase/helicase
LESARPVPTDNPYLIRKAITPLANLREKTAEAVAKALGYAPKSNGRPLVGRLPVVPIDQGRQPHLARIVRGFLLEP